MNNTTPLTQAKTIDAILAPTTALLQKFTRGNEGCPLMAIVIPDMKAALATKRLALAAFYEHGDGLTLQAQGREQWAMIFPDVSGGGAYRVQYFDRRGFFGHGVYTDASAAIIAAVDDGYTDLDAGRLSELAQTKGWQNGMEVTHIIQRHNAGLIGWDEALAAMAATRG